MRTNFSGNPSFLELLATVREVALEAYEYRDLPFEKLVEELQPERDLITTPIFQVFINMYNFKEDELNLEGLIVQPLKRRADAPQFDLEFYIREHQDGTHLSFVYDSDLFEANSIERMLGHFQTLLEGIVADPNQRISELPLLAEVEKQQILVDWNDTHRDYPKDKCVHELFETQVEKTPDAIAVVFEDQRLTYRELNTRANQLAHHLRKRGVQPETLVAVCMERSLEMVIGILGVVKVGGAYVPIDPDSPTDRLRFMLQDAQASLILTQEKISSYLVEFGDQRICLDDAGVDLSLESKENFENGVNGKNAAYMIYTSGSTGTPQGVVNVHGGLRNRLQWMQEAYRLTPADRVLQKTPFTFDVSVWEFFWPLISGACLVIARPGGHRDSAYLVQLIKSERITLLHFVPSMLGMFLQEEGVESCSTLRQVICSGEALSYELQQRFFERMSVAFSNLYGPTEASIDVTAWECRSDSDRTIVPIGRPIANTEIYILDGDLNPLPIGVVGEIYIGGDGVARGYRNRPELTAEKFIPDPFSTDPGARIYKTGDRARYLPDGTIVFLGRTDHQVKIRGYRIELGEIEATLVQHLTIKESVVLAREDTVGDQRLVAYVVGAGGSNPSAHDLRKFLQQKLPEYMVPSAFIFLESLPITPNGKLDRKALPAADQTRPELKDAYSPPQTPVEESLSQIWCDVLKLDKAGVHDNFFDLGGHSLTATQLISRVRDSFKLDLPLRTLFEAPTIYDLAQRVQELGEKQDVMQETKITRIAREQYRLRQKK
jgi:amino acid adenylation domain-containing protein